MVRAVDGTSTAVRLPVGFAGLDAPERWPIPPSAPRPERLDVSIETLHGVGPTLARKLTKLDIRTVGDLLWQRPRRYEEALLRPLR